MRVADDRSCRVELLRRAVVVGVGVDEGSGLEVVDSHRHSESLVGRNRVAVCRVGELGRRHVRRRRDLAHRRGVAGARLDLLAIRYGHVYRQAEVDEVVLRRERGRLACGGSGLAILLEARCNDRWVQG